MPTSNVTTVKGGNRTETDVTVEDGEIQVSAYAGDYAPATSAYHTPAQARELAATLLRAADEAEGVPHLPDVIKKFMDEHPGWSPTGRQLSDWKPPMQ
ncbi:hypothetical protein J7I94_19405 [Streptomyces sp. ISL-12]|uniref:hypothetical protein n=1 Tax=Streptomyces sp. ISL-12 TaxID=2819177 RepID=UPI001BE5B21C|nr:hypothetical protein [Streptomyces sp. ISL-12]MBT2412701.1 hypothetical protein [Streptomyces sp. ISL-12]